MWEDRLWEIAGRRRVARLCWLAVAVMISWLHLFRNATRIDHLEFILDEAGTWGVARRSLGTLLTLPTEFHSQPPLYYFVFHFLLAFDSSPLFLRGFSWFCCLLFLLYVLFYLHELNLIARVFLCLVFIYSDLTTLLAQVARPYGMAALLTLISCVLLWRLVQQPERRRAVPYVVVTLAMLYTMAFEVAVLATQGLYVAGLLVVQACRLGLRGVARRYQALALAMTAVVAGYLPYLAMAVHYQYKENATRTIDKVLEVATYGGTLDKMFRFSEPMLLGLCSLALVALVRDVMGRRSQAWMLALVAVGQIAFVYFFLVGRSLVQEKYMMPAFVAVALMAALGFQELARVPARPVWVVLPAVLLWLLMPAWEDFRGWWRGEVPVGQFQLLHDELAKHPGKKVVFFDVGYEGQHLEYIARHDPDIVYGNMAGTGWATGGDNHLSDDYVSKLIESTKGSARCYFFYLRSATAPYTTAFLPAMKKLGYVEVPALPHIHGRMVPGFCKK